MKSSKLTVMLKLRTACVCVRDAGRPRSIARAAEVPLRNTELHLLSPPHPHRTRVSVVLQLPQDTAGAAERQSLFWIRSGGWYWWWWWGGVGQRRISRGSIVSLKQATCPVTAGLAEGVEGRGQRGACLCRRTATPACRTWSTPPRSVSAASPAQRSCSPAASLWSPPPPCCCCCWCWRWKRWPQRWSWAW